MISTAAWLLLSYALLEIIAVGKIAVKGRDASDAVGAVFGIVAILFNVVVALALLGVIG